MTQRKGFGLFANKNIKRGKTICDYGGELICGSAEIAARHLQHSMEGETGGYMYEFKYNGKQYW